MAWVRVLKVLMWKHLVVRKRSYICLHVIEFCPLLLFLALFVFRAEIHKIGKDTPPGSTNTTSRTSPPPVEIDLVDSPLKVLYYPNTNVNNALMQKVGRKLGLRRLESAPSNTGEELYGFNAENEVLQHASNMTENDAIVLFEDIIAFANSTDDIPKELQYTIRVKENYRTEMYTALDPDEEHRQDDSQPHENFGTIYEPFMRLQWAIDSSYLEMTSGGKIPQRRVFLQEMPYYRATQPQTIIQSVPSLLACFCTDVFIMNLLNICVARFVDDRSGGVVELIKLSGATSNVLFLSYFLNMLPVVVITSLVAAALLSCGSNPVLAEVGFGHFFLILLLTGLSMVILSYVASYFFTSSNTASHVIGLFSGAVFLLGLVLTIKTKGHELYFLGVLPAVPMIWFFNDAALIYKPTPDTVTRTVFSARPSILDAHIFAALHIVVFVCLMWYVDKVHPGEYGVARPWYFPFTRNYWCPKKVRPQDIPLVSNGASSSSSDNVQQSKHFEPIPPNSIKGIEVINVSKIFYKMGEPVYQALKNVSFDVLKGEITVLLGHNGAGKSTLMHIITGMYGATEGDVFINGYHSVRDRERIIRHTGYCPQHNMFIEQLNVLEQVMFFSMLKGLSYKEAKESSLAILASVGLLPKANTAPVYLSGGMQRRLQVCCALTADSDVLLLDEPTSGLDVDTRRKLSDFILTLRGSRTVLITTHFMEEADALADRIVALHEAKTRLAGTPMFLKRAVGSGYRLSIVTKDVLQEPAITSEIQNHLPSATVRDISYNTIIYNLPADTAGKLPAMFNGLETDKKALKIESIGVGAGTLEDVFMSLLGNVRQDEVLSNKNTEPQDKQYKGIKLRMRQLTGLIKRNALFTWDTKYLFIFVFVIAPLVVVVLNVHFSNAPNEILNPQRRMSLDMYQGIPGPKALYNLKAENFTFRRTYSKMYPFIQFEKADDIVEVWTSVQTALENNGQYRSYLMGIELNDTDAKVVYSTAVRHAGPVALNLLSNVLASMYTQEDPHRRSITTLNYPIKGAFTFRTGTVRTPKANNLMGAILVIISLATCFVMNLPIVEKRSSMRRVYLMQGVSPTLYWATTYMYHLALYIVLLVIPSVIIMALMEQDKTFDEPWFLATAFLIMVLGGISSFPFMYLLTCWLSPVMATIIVDFFILGSAILAAIEANLSASTKRFFQLFFWVPWKHYLKAEENASAVAKINALCTLNRDKCPDFVMPDKEPCCTTTGNVLSFATSFSAERPLQPMVIMLVLGLAYFVLLVNYELGLFDQLFEKIRNMRYRQKPPHPEYNDENVTQEKQYVDSAVARAKNGDMSDTFLAQNLHKNYTTLVSCKSVNAVKGISISVKIGECFGLLGVNGAGKSTTFKLITCELYPTLGELWCNDYGAKANRRQYIKSLSYCPQAQGVDGFLSVRNNLKLLLTLRGFTARDVDRITEVWIECVGLARYASRPTSTYSGGCRRRAAAAAALAVRPRLALLDEPSAGIDAAARRQLWAALKQQGNTRLICSHSMDEIEALCDRLAIMCGGEVAALGAPAAVRHQHATGHALVVKVRLDATPLQVESLKTAIMSAFGSAQCELKDEHRSMLHYHINETMRNSVAFATLEAIKESQPAIEDYSLTETTLEEVFIALAKAQQEKEEQNKKSLSFFSLKMGLKKSSHSQ